MKRIFKPEKKRHPVRNTLLIILILFIAGYAGYRLIDGYISSLPKLTYAYGSSVQQAKYPECKFAVLSDLHYYDKSLGSQGKAFEQYLAQDRKLLVESADILNAAIDNILASGVKLVLISGDLTKDGERVNHEKVAAALGRLTEAEIKVRLVPGNHDVLNGWAYSYNGDATAPVQNVTPEDFAAIYKNFGYGDALYRDSGSLSYVSEPVNGMWLVCLDACRYRENQSGEEPKVAGGFTQSLETWLEDILRKAGNEGKAVTVLMHHGIVEHWKGQSEFHAEYLVEDYKHIGEVLASYGVRLAFTGHYHAQDIALGDFGGKGFLLDVETGSLVTDPCPVRYCTVDASQNLNFTAVRLADSMYPGQSFGQFASFEQYAAGSLKDSIAAIARQKLKGYSVSDEDAATISRNVSEAFIAHYAGSEDVSKRPALDAGKLNLWSQVVYSTQRYVLDGLWNDPYVKEENNGAVSLVTGK